MNPANRVMKMVTITDATAADETFDILMGADVAPRKNSSKLTPRMRTWTFDPNLANLINPCYRGFISPGRAF